MPIRAERKGLYPRDWKSRIVPMIRARSGNRCEGSPKYPDCRAENGRPHPVTGAIVRLTTAHLNHDESDSRPENLRHWCERCHNTYDMPNRVKNARLRRDRERGQLSMIEE